MCTHSGRKLDGRVQVPGIAGGRPRVVVVQDLGQLGKRPLHGAGVEPDAVKPQVRVVGGRSGGGISEAQALKVGVHG